MASEASEESGVNKEESTSIASQAAPVAFTPPSANANGSERASLSQSQCVLSAMISCRFGLNASL